MLCYEVPAALQAMIDARDSALRSMTTELMEPVLALLPRIHPASGGTYTRASRDPVPAAPLLSVAEAATGYPSHADAHPRGCDPRAAAGPRGGGRRLCTADGGALRARRQPGRDMVDDLVGRLRDRLPALITSRGSCTISFSMNE